MSSRLKRKLGDIGVDPSSARASESFCFIGTPLPPLEKSRDTGEFVPLWKQEVRDEKGRRRLHGAFTGGFSAGYFNTVGSKEGWAPTEFISSRSSRAKQKAARPEDFMDEEDLAEFKESQKLVDENDEMDLLGGTQAELERKGGAGETDEGNDIARALETSMLPPPKDSVGARILKKMGWRIGQGIGPRLTWRQKKLQDAAMSSSAAPTEEIDDEEASKHTYAPRDTPVLLVRRKDNAHGLGYSPGMGLNETLGVKGAGPSAGPRLAAGFGLGALNDADDDDLDVYEGTDLSSRGKNRTAYDIADRDDDDRIAIGRSGTTEHGARKPESRSTSSVEVFRNGRPVLPGFVLSDKPVAEDGWFPLPEIPKGWKPNPRSVWEKDAGKENIPKNEEPSQPLSHTAWKRSGISADERGAILGETPLPAAPRSVFAYMSQKDRERLQSIASGQGGAPQPAAAPSIVIPRTEPHIAQAALRGFQPFATDPVKQARYNAYLQSQASPDSGAALAPSPGQKVDEFNKELADYAKAALIFKPISGAMAGRFTSAAVVDQGPRIIEGLHTPSAAELEEKDREAQKAVEQREESPKAHAARMGMYGPMTRETKLWQPAKLLCKRFGVKDPHPEPVVEDPSRQPEGSAATFTAEAENPIAPDASFRTELGGSSTARKGGPRDLDNVGLGEDDDQGRDTLTYVRPAMDIFKAIFASDEEDSGDEAEVKDEEDEKPVVSVPASVPSIGSETSTSAAPPPAVPVPTPAPPLGEKVDMNTFKPTFVPRSDRTTKPKHKDKDKKDKKKGKVLVSFELDEDESTVPRRKDKDKDKERPKKKKRKDMDRAKDEDEDDGMWVEKPPPDAVKILPDVPARPDIPDEQHPKEAGPPKARKRAIDFM